MICQDCGCEDLNPYRVYGDDGSILFGCVSEDHESCLPVIADPKYTAWYFRREAAKIREISRLNRFKEKRALEGGKISRLSRIQGKIVPKEEKIGSDLTPNLIQVRSFDHFTVHGKHGIEDRRL